MCSRTYREQLARLPHVVPLAMELTSRTHAGPEEPIPRRPILSPEKLAAEGAPAEIQQVLGWTIDTRRLTVSLPKDKFTMWVNDVRRIQKARRVSTELLATIEGRLNHTASIIPMARHFLTRLRKLTMTTLSAARPYTKIPDEVMADLQLWEKLLTTAHKGVSINLLTTRRPDIIGWSDACPFGMGGYNTAGRAWRLLIDPKSPIFGESRVNNALEYLAMTVNAIVSCRDVPDQPSPCVLALGDNTSAIGWLYRSSRLHQPHHAVHLQIARHLANEMIQNDCCLYSQHIPGARNIIADLLSYDGQGRDKPHPIAHDQPDDATLTRRFHASPHYSSQITSNFRISPLPPDIDSWLRRTLQTLESYASVELSSPSSPPTEHGGDGAATVVNSETPMTPHWTDYQHPHDNLSQKPLPNASAMPFGTQTATHSLIASVRERYYRGLSDKPSASWQRRVGGVDGRAPSTTRRHPHALLPDIAQLLLSFSERDPPTSKQCAVTPHFLRQLHRLSQALPDNNSHQALTQVAVMSFFFALRSCEAMETPTPGRTQAVTLHNLTFRDAHQQTIPLHDPHITNAQSITICFTTQKNGQKAEKRTQARTNDPELCPVRSIATLVNNILNRVPHSPLTTPLCTVFINNTNFDSRRLTNSDLLTHLRRACTLLGGHNAFGFSGREIGTRSLRSGAAMALFLAGHPPANIMLLGRWRSTAFLQYIRPQILEWTSSLSTTMLLTDDFRDADAAQHDPSNRYRSHPPPPLRSPISFIGPPFTQVERDSMARPEKDTTDPKKETRKGGKGCKSPTKRSKILLRLGASVNQLPGAGIHSTRQTQRTVFDAARIVDMSEGSNERNQSRTKRKTYGVSRHSNSNPQPSYKWTQIP